VAASSSNNSILKHFLWLQTVSALTHNISTFLGENQWLGTTKFCLKITWTAVPVSLNEMRRSFQLHSDQVLSDKCSSSIARDAESNRHCRWMTRRSSLSFWRPARQTFASAASICSVTEIIMSTVWYRNISSPRTSSCTSSCTSQHVTYKT